jgi:hypothetical protein
MTDQERHRAMSRRDAEAQANDQLTQALVCAAARGVRPRCADGETSWMWLDEDPRTRSVAATYCAGCVVWSECDQVGRYQTFGTYASKDRTVRAGRRLQRDDAATQTT